MKRGNHSRPRRRFRSRVTAIYTGACLGILASLFALAWGANRVEQLECRRTDLQDEIEYQRDEYRRLLAAWLDATSREHVVPRAQFELALVEPRVEERTLLVLPEEERVRHGLPSFLEHLARGFDRYGEISSASAEERP